MDELLDELWDQMHTSLFKKLYYEASSRRYKQRSTILTMTQAIVTPSAMGSWVIWEVQVGTFEMKWIWSCLIAVAGIVAVLQPILGYTRIVEASGNALTRWKDLHVEYRILWRNRSILTEAEVRNQLNTLERTSNESVNDELDVPRNRSLEERCYNEAVEILSK